MHIQIFNQYWNRHSYRPRVQLMKKQPYPRGLWLTSPLFRVPCQLPADTTEGVAFLDPGLDIQIPIPELEQPLCAKSAR